MDIYEFRPIGYIHTDFNEKFGIPRQSGIVKDTQGYIQFEPEFRVEEAFRGLEDYSHIWLIWLISENIRKGFNPTVRPPRLGGNVRMGVFATRSPFRPNPIGLSCVKLEGVEFDSENGPIVRVSGADLMDGTPILDIKPYILYADCIPDAQSSFAQDAPEEKLSVIVSDDIKVILPEDKLNALCSVLANDPRPAYQDDPDREYGMTFAGKNVVFKVRGKELTIIHIE